MKGDKVSQLLKQRWFVDLHIPTAFNSRAISGILITRKPLESDAMKVMQFGIQSFIKYLSLPKCRTLNSPWCMTNIFSEHQKVYLLCVDCVFKWKILEQIGGRTSQSRVTLALGLQIQIQKWSIQRTLHLQWNRAEARFCGRGKWTQWRLLGFCKIILLGQKKK